MFLVEAKPLKRLDGSPRAAVAALLAPLASVLSAPPAHSADPAAAEPPGIADNSFFIEEAYNQEKGVVQHIQNGVWTRDRDGSATTRAFAYSFTQEWPLGGMEHQLSYTVPYERLGGDQPRASGAGDVLLNYRYQFWKESDTRPAFAPRISLIFPSGDDGEGIGAGSFGYQINFPLSKKVGDFLHLHLNAGATALPGARRDLPGGGESPSRDLLGTHLGFSAILLLRPELNVLLEFLASQEEGIDDLGVEEEASRALFSPGLRYAFNLRSGAQWVLGAAAPIGMSEDEDDVGLLLYLSFEHPF